MRLSRSGHPATAGTRACWEAGCVQYMCLFAAGIDPVKVDRALARTGSLASMVIGLTPDERVEFERRYGELHPA